MIIPTFWVCYYVDMKTGEWLRDWSKGDEYDINDDVEVFSMVGKEG